MSASSSSSARSSIVPSPSVMRVRISSRRRVPSRQGTHLPQDSDWVNSMKKRAMLDHAGVLVHDHQPAGADDGARGGQGFVIQRQVEMLLGQTAAGGSADLHGLEVPCRRGCRRRSRRSSSRSVVPRGTSTRPVLTILPERLKVLVPGLLLGAEGPEGGGAVRDDGGDVGESFHVIDESGLAPQAALHREGRLGPRHSPLPFEGGDQGRLFAADEGARAFLHLQMEGRPEPRMLSPSRPAASAGLDGLAQALHGQRDTRRARRRSPAVAPMARAAMVMPSMTLWGSPSMTQRSMKAPGSPSSPLQMTYFCLPPGGQAKRHFRPVGKPAPPRPRRPEASTSPIT